jgi:hypothetical protein
MSARHSSASGWREAAHQLLYDTRHMPNSKLNSYFKVVDALPVAPIAAAAQLGWRNVFTTHLATPETARPHGTRKGKGPGGLPPASATPATAAGGLSSPNQPSAFSAYDRKKGQLKGTSALTDTCLPSDTARATVGAHTLYAQGLDGTTLPFHTTTATGTSNLPMMSDQEQRRQALQGRVEGLWEELHVPEGDRAFVRSTHFLSPSPETAEGQEEGEGCRALLHEFVSLLHHRQATLDVLRAIRERERCLYYLRAMLAKFQRQPRTFADVDKGDVLRRMLVECLGLARDTSLLTVEAMLRWRKGLWRPQPFLWRAAEEEEGTRPVNYVERMGSDVAVLLETEGGGALLSRVGLGLGDLGLLVPHAGKEKEGNEGAGKEGVGEEGGQEAEEFRAARERHLPLFLRHSFQNDAEPDFACPQLRRRQRAAIKVGAFMLSLLDDRILLFTLHFLTHRLPRSPVDSFTAPVVMCRRCVVSVRWSSTCGWRPSASRSRASSSPCSASSRSPSCTSTCCTPRQPACCRGKRSRRRRHVPAQMPNRRQPTLP